jgi:hypothetical protein
MPRTKEIFEKVFSLPNFKEVTSANKIFRRNSIHLSFMPVEPGIEDPLILKARREKELSSAKGFQESTATKWKSLQELHDWLFTEHEAYASKRLTKTRPKITNDALLKSY